MCNLNKSEIIKIYKKIYLYSAPTGINALSASCEVSLRKELLISGRLKGEIAN